MAPATRSLSSTGRGVLAVLLLGSCALLSVNAQVPPSSGATAAAGTPPAATSLAQPAAPGGGDAQPTGDSFSGGLSAADQALIDGFTDTTAQPANLFDTSSPSKNYGVAPQFNTTAGGNMTRLRYSGTGTVSYDELPIASSGAVNLGCGFGFVDPSFQGAYVGVGSSFFNKAFSCGRCIRIQCDDVTCASPGTQAVAQIVDNCGECFDADMNVATPLFQKIAGRAANPNPSLAISWDFIDCSPYVNTTIKMLVKPGGSAYYQGFNFANPRQVITAVQVNGQLLKHETNNYWSWSPTGKAIDPKGPFNFALLGANRQVLRVKVGQLRSQDLKVQFAAPVARPPPGAEALPAGVAPPPPTAAGSAQPAQPAAAGASAATVTAQSQPGGR